MLADKFFKGTSFIICDIENCFKGITLLLAKDAKISLKKFIDIGIIFKSIYMHNLSNLLIKCSDLTFSSNLTALQNRDPQFISK